MPKESSGNFFGMEHSVEGKPKLIHGRRLLQLSLKDGEFLFFSQIKKRLLYHIDKREIINAQRRLKLGGNIRKLSDQEIDSINLHILQSGSEAVVNSNCQLLCVDDAEKLYNYLVTKHGPPSHLTQDSRNNRSKSNSVTVPSSPSCSTLFTPGLKALKEKPEHSKITVEIVPVVGPVTDMKPTSESVVSGEIQHNTSTGERNDKNDETKEKSTKTGNDSEMKSSDSNNNTELNTQPSIVPLPPPETSAPPISQSGEDHSDPLVNNPKTKPDAMLSEDKTVRPKQYSRKQATFCPKVTQALAANTTCDVIDLLQKQGIREDTDTAEDMKPLDICGHLDSAATVEIFESQGAHALMDKTDQVDTNSDKAESNTGYLEKSPNSFENQAGSQLALEENSNYLKSSSQHSVSTVATIEQASNMSETLPSSDFTASAFIKSNYEVLAQDPYSGPLVSVDMMNSTVEELGIRKGTLVSLCDTSVCSKKELEAVKLPSKEPGFKEKVQKSDLTLTLKRPSADFAAQLNPSSSCLDNQLLELRKLLDQTKCPGSGVQCNNVSDIPEALLSVKDKMTNCIDLSDKLSVTLESLMKGLEEEKVAMKTLTQEIQQLSQQTDSY